MDVRSYGAQFGGNATDAARQAMQATVDAASRSRVKRTGFGFKFGKLGVHYSSERVDIEGEQAKTDQAARPNLSDLDDRTRRAKAMYEQGRTQAFGSSQSQPAPEDGEMADPQDLRRRRSLQNALNAYIDTENQLENRDLEPRLLAVV